MSHASGTIRVLPTMIGTAMLAIGLFIIVVALIPPADFIIALFGVISLSAGVLIIYLIYFRKEEAFPVRPPPIGGTSEAQRPSEEEAIMPSPPAKTTETHLATLSSPRGNLYVTGVVQEFRREDFKGLIPEDLLSLIKRSHFRIRLQGDKGYLTSEDLKCKRYKIYIEDLGGINGTFVNGVNIRGKGLVPLKRGDRINVAGVIELTIEY